MQEQRSEWFISPLFSFMGLLLWWSLAHKRNTPSCLHLTELTSLLWTHLWNAQFNSEHQTILTLPPFDHRGHSGLLLSSFMWQMIQPRLNLPADNNKVDGFQPVNIIQRKVGGGASVTSISRTSTVCYYGNPCANAVSLAIYQGAGCHATIPCVIIKRIQTQMQLL